MALFFRVALPDDVPALAALEQQCFSGDRLSRRSFHWMIRRAHGQLLVVHSERQLLGYGLVLLRNGSALARVYSLATAEHARGLGVGRQLLARLETYALQHACSHIRLEVRSDNPVALSLYERNGYRCFARVENYYADRTPALRLEKALCG